jgi:penicillin-binding protein 1A
MKRLGPEVIIQMVRKMGITAPIEPYPSIALGTPEISALEMAGAYTVLANKGTYSQPNYINSILTKDGLQLYKGSPETHDVMSEEQAYVMIELLRYVTNKGTGGRLRYRYKLTADICGKTGTTNDNTDGWYIGYTPQFIGAVWTGGEDNKVRFRSTALGQGANMALPIWGLFAQKLYADKTLGYSEAMRFPVPAGKLPVELDCSKYKAQGNSLPSTTNPSNPDAWDNPP